MRRLITLVPLILVKVCFSQQSLSIGPDLAFAPNFSETMKVGFGGSLEYVNKFSENIGFRGSVSYTRFKDQNTSAISIFPIRVGINVFLANIIYVYGETGIANFNNSINSQTNFSYALGAGYRATFGSKKEFIQVSTRYNSVSEGPNTWFNLSVAYGFGFGKQ